MVFIPNTVRREELLERPTTESTRMGVHLDLHDMLHNLLRRKHATCDTPPWRIVLDGCVWCNLVLVLRIQTPIEPLFFLRWHW